ncbi:ankyrin repeat-containing domain protein [Copromyces sp. CBS 386.78]|nr:ankyrin repeat-containing domain protein [Copromyces sp. CBS 386.78]
MAALINLPPELLLNVVQHLDFRDLASAIRVTRFCHLVLTGELYNDKGKKEAVRWAADNGSCLVMRTALSHCTQELERDRFINRPIPNSNQDPHRPVSATPLARASYRGHLDLVKYLLDVGANPAFSSRRLCTCIDLQSIFEGFEGHDAPNVPAWYPLHYAICSKNEEVALLLIDRGAPLVACDGDHNITALQSAAANGCPKVVHRLAKRYRELTYGPLVNPGHEKDVGRLLDPRATDARLHTAMHYLTLCPRREHIGEICLCLMDLGIPLDTPWGSMAMSPLLMACALGNFTVGTEFVQFGANLQRRDPTEEERQQHLQAHVMPEHRQGNAPYVYTALGVAYKQAKQAGVVWRPGGQARWEIERQNFIRVFIQHNGKANNPVSLAGDTALARAADRGLVAEIQILVSEGGAVVDRPDAFGMTPLCKAALRGRFAAVEALLEAGADPNLPSRIGHVTALELISGMIASPEIEQIMILLLRYGTRVGRLSPRSSHQYDRTYLISLLKRVLERNNHSDYLAMKTILENSTEANISRGCWQYAAEVALRLNKNGDSKKPGDRGMCLHLGYFGEKVGYVFDDSRLCSIVKQLIQRGYPGNMPCLFSLGGSNIELRAQSYFHSVVKTLSGAFTREAMLTLALTHSEKSALPLVTQLLAEYDAHDYDFTGRIHCLSTKPTLLHLACSNGDWGSAGLLITKGCSADAVNGCLLTPMAEAAARGYRKLVEALMDCTSADPHESYRTPSTTTRLLQDQVAAQGDFLRPPPGTKISQFVIRELIKLQGAPLGFPNTDTSNQHSIDPSLPKKGGWNHFTPHHYGFSAFEAACHEGQSDVVKAILKRKPLFRHPMLQVQWGFMALKPSFSPLTDAALNGHWDTVHILLRHGADPNQGILRGCLDLTPLHICVEALVHTVRLYNVEAETLATEQPIPPGSDLEAPPPFPADMHPQLRPFVQRIQKIVRVIVHLKKRGAKEESDNGVFREVHQLPGEPFSQDTMGLLRRLTDMEEPGYMGGRFMERHGEVVVTRKFTLDAEGKKMVLFDETKGNGQSKNEGEGEPNEGNEKPKKGDQKPKKK